jgi:hypothetical protein
MKKRLLLLGSVLVLGLGLASSGFAFPWAQSASSSNSAPGLFVVNKANTVIWFARKEKGPCSAIACALPKSVSSKITIAYPSIPAGYIWVWKKYKLSTK